MDILARIRSVPVLVTFLGVSACGGDGQLPAISECRVIPAIAGNDSVFEFDKQDLSLRVDFSGQGIRYDVFDYASKEDFVAERDVFGRVTWRRHEEVTEGPITEEIPEYDSEGQLSGLFIDTEDFGSYETDITVDTWDDEGRPKRAFIAKYESPDYLNDDRENLVCDSIMREYEYDSVAGTIVTRDSPGIDPDDGSPCGGPKTIRITYDFYPYWITGHEEWDDIVDDLASRTPNHSYYKDRSDVTKMQEICF